MVELAPGPFAAAGAGSPPGAVQLAWRPGHFQEQIQADVSPGDDCGDLRQIEPRIGQRRYCSCARALNHQMVLASQPCNGVADRSLINLYHSIYKALNNRE